MDLGRNRDSRCRRLMPPLLIQVGEMPLDTNDYEMCVAYPTWQRESTSAEGGSSRHAVLPAM
ncbi:MAG: hypothetical protein R6V55_06315, partial [Desulfovermiculus sp.]